MGVVSFRFALDVLWRSVVLSGIGCASSIEKSGPDQVRMAPMVVRSALDPLTGLEGYDAGVLLEFGNQRYAEEAYDRALAVYRRLTEEFPASEHVAVATYNIGLCLEQLAEYDDAAQAYARVIEDHPDARPVREAHFRRAFVLAKAERWREVAETFWAVRQLSGLTTMNELEARAGQGVGMFMQGDYATAEFEFRGALAFYEKHKNEEFIPARYYVGQSRFYIGEIYARAFEKLPLSVPDAAHDAWVEMMGRKLEEKCSLLLRAQQNFIRAIRVGHPGWATAAGFRIGSLYEGLYDALLEVPVPPELTEEQQVDYQEALKKRVSVLVMKAIKVYETSLAMARRVGEDNEWVEKTSASLERMKSLYMAELDIAGEAS